MFTSHPELLHMCVIYLRTIEEIIHGVGPKIYDIISKPD